MLTLLLQSIRLKTEVYIFWRLMEVQIHSTAAVYLHFHQSGIHLAELVRQSSYSNRWGAQMQVPSNWNLQLLESPLEDYWDKEIVSWMKFGWPRSRLPTLEDPRRANGNYDGAELFPEDIEKYLKEGLEKGHIMGPFSSNPFNQWTGISPLNTCPK